MSRTFVERELDEGSSVGPGLFWIKNFCNKAGNEMFVEIDEDFILDRFNLTGIGHEVAFAQKSYDYITRTASEVEEEEEEEDSSSSSSSDDNEAPEDDASQNVEDTNSTNNTKNKTTTPQKGKPSHEKVLQGSRMLYGLIHSRYVLEANGMAKMKDKFIQGCFGQCPRVFCEGQTLLPIGLSDLPKVDSVKLFCARCGDVYNPRSKRHLSIDGAYWGTTFAHLFRQNFPNLFGSSSTFPPSTGSDSVCKYVPKIFGYKINTNTSTSTSTIPPQ